MKFIRLFSNNCRVISAHTGRANRDLRTPRSINVSNARRIASPFSHRATNPGSIP